MLRLGCQEAAKVARGLRPPGKSRPSLGAGVGVGRVTIESEGRISAGAPMNISGLRLRVRPRWRR